MIEWIVQPVAELMMSKGMDRIQNTAEFKHSQKAIRQAIFREMQFNQQLLNEASNNQEDAELRKCLADEFSFSAFEKVEDSFIPVDLYFLNEVNFERERDEVFKERVKSIRNEADLVTRCYLRLKVIRARWRSGQEYQHGSVDYADKLMRAWFRECTTDIQRR